MKMSRENHNNLCIHGPGSPDRCGHPDCVGARWVEHEDLMDLYLSSTIDPEPRPDALMWPHNFEHHGWRLWLCRLCYAPRSMHPRLRWVRGRVQGDMSYLSASAPHFKEGW